MYGALLVIVAQVAGVEVSLAEVKESHFKVFMSDTHPVLNLDHFFSKGYIQTRIKIVSEHPNQIYS